LKNYTANSANHLAKGAKVEKEMEVVITIVISAIIHASTKINEEITHTVGEIHEFF
jgi:hypothetical protein